MGRQLPRRYSLLAAAVLAVTPLVVGVGVLGQAPAAGAATRRTPPVYQLSLGDSLTAGWGASSPAKDFANLIGDTQSARFAGLRVKSLACPGATTTTLLEGGGWCSYAQGSQLAAAEAFLAAHPGRVRYITLDIGINNIDVCPDGGGFNPACVAAGTASAQHDLQLIMAGLRSVAPAVPIIGATTYDPYLAEAPIAGDPAAQYYTGDAGIAGASLPVVDAFNQLLRQLYDRAGVQVADVAGAFATDDSAMTGSFDGAAVPQNVSDICAWTHMCDSSGWTLHFNDAGEREVADTFDTVIDQTVPTPGAGSWLVSADGSVDALGTAPVVGDLTGTSLHRPIVGMAATGDGRGYWLVASDGGVFSFGDAGYYGSTGGFTLNRPIVGMAPTADDRGYWLVASDGGIFSFGDAHFYGSTGGRHLNQPIVGMAATADGRGYWLVASDGGIFSFGDARFAGSTGGITLHRPIVGMAGDGTDHGYWLVASDGGVFAFGGAPFDGSTGGMTLNRPVVGMVAAPGDDGYSLVASDGGVFAFGDARFTGSAGGSPPEAPVVATATT